MEDGSQAQRSRAEDAEGNETDPCADNNNEGCATAEASSSSVVSLEQLNQLRSELENDLFDLVRTVVTASTSRSRFTLADLEAAREVGDTSAPERIVDVTELVSCCAKDGCPPVVEFDYCQEKIDRIIQTYFTEEKPFDSSLKTSETSEGASPKKKGHVQNPACILGEEMSPIFNPKCGVAPGAQPPLPRRPKECPLVLEERFYLAQPFGHLLVAMKTLDCSRRLLMVLNALRVKLQVDSSHKDGPPEALTEDHITEVNEIMEQIKLDERHKRQAYRIEFVRHILMKYQTEGDSTIAEKLDFTFILESLRPLAATLPLDTFYERIFKAAKDIQDWCGIMDPALPGSEVEGCCESSPEEQEEYHGSD